VIDTWLHTKSGIVALWRHGWPRVVEIERDGVKNTEVWSGNFNCWEPEDVLRRQHKRNEDGSRIIPPKVCPMCILIEHIRDEVRAGRIGWLDPVFAFKGEDEKTSITLTAAGMYNGFGGELSRQDVADMRRAGIQRTEAWKQNTMPKCSYVFSVLDNGAPEAGVMPAIETTALGDAVKRVIRDMIESLGETEGHPLRTPYAIRWMYQPEEAEFNKKYRALAMPRLAYTDEIRALIEESPAPDISNLIGRGDIATLRASMEEHALIKLPFDRIFAAAEAEGGGQRSAAAPKAPPSAPRAPEVHTEPAKAEPARARRGSAAKAEPKKPDYPPGTVIIPCDRCGAEMADYDDTCWKCGAKYELDDADVAPPTKTPAKASTKQAPSQAWAGEGEDDLGF
jgi:hypothetical protein